MLLADFFGVETSSNVSTLAFSTLSTLQFHHILSMLGDEDSGSA